jgi:nicotinamide mononucleotide transporter
MTVPGPTRAGNALARAALYAALTGAATLALLPWSAWTEALGAATGALCVWLAARSDPWTWPIGIANNLLYLVVFWTGGLYADSILQLFYAAVSVYGIWRWRSGRGAAAVRPVARVSRREGLLLTAVGAVFATALAVMLGRTTPSTVPWADAVTTTMSLAAQWLMGRRFLENWWVWIAVDLLYVPLYLYKDLAVTAVLYAVFLAMCVQGLVHWRREMTA